MPDPLQMPTQSCPFPKIYPSELDRGDLYYMQLAYNQAIEAWKADEVPIGAVIVNQDQVVAAAHNVVIQQKDPTAHAEILAITQASRKIGDWRLHNMTLYVTKEPCPMCSGAIIMSRLKRVVYAFADSKMGCLGGATNLNELPESNHRCILHSGVFEKECRNLVQSFFQLKRGKS